jgi:hypothetical protein
MNYSPKRSIKVPRRKQRKSAADLIRSSETLKARNISWYRNLRAEDQTYVDEVVRELADNSNAAVYVVAESLISELDINRQVETVCRTLKKMVKHANQT